jgi:hypothetical protein
VHIFFGIAGYRIAYSRSTNNGLSWEPLRDIITDTVHFSDNFGKTFPVVDGGRLYEFFSYGTPELYPLYVMYSDDRGETWVQPQAINDTNSFIRGVAVLGDSIAIFGLFAGHGYDRTIFSTDRGVTWAYAIDSVEGSINAGGLSNASVVFTHGYLHIVYHWYFEVRYRRSTDLGNTWGPYTIISDNDNYGSIEAEMTSQPEGNLYVVWRDCKYGCLNGFAGSIVFRKSTNNGNYWEDEVPLTETPWGTFKSIAVHDSILTVSWDSDVGGNIIETRTSFDNGNNWCTLINIASSVSYSAGVPVSAIGKKSIVTAWEQRDSLYDDFHTRCRTSMLTPIGINENFSFLPANFRVLQVYPNPFNSTAIVKYYLPQSNFVNIRVYNILGEPVASLLNLQQEPGWHETVWNASNATSGLYFIRLTSRTFQQTTKILFLK